MNVNPSFRYSATLVLALLFMVGIARADNGLEQTDTIKKTFKVREGGTLFIDIDRGNVEVDAGREDDAVYVIMERNVEADDREEVKRVLENHEWDMFQEGKDVFVESRFEENNAYWKRWSKGNHFRLHITIRVPENYNIDFTNGAGNVTVDDVIGEVEGRTGAGNVIIGRVEGSVDVSSGAGNIDVDGAVGRVRVNSGAGNITVGRVDGEIRANTGAGNITARIASQPEGDSHLETGAGNVTVYLDDEVGVYVDAHASVGSANCDFGLKVKGKWMTKSFGGRINGGGPELHMRSGVGNVTLRKM